MAHRLRQQCDKKRKKKERQKKKETPPPAESLVLFVADVNGFDIFFEKKNEKQTENRETEKIRRTLRIVSGQADGSTAGANSKQLATRPLRCP